MKRPNNTIPVIIVSGFLGSGKTTLLNNILKANTDYKFLVIVNDFGDISLDEKIIVNDDIITFPNGCLCCSLGNNFVESLINILKQDIRFDYIVIEASGISNPNNIAEVVYLMPELELFSMYTIIDSTTFMAKRNDSRLKDIIENQLIGASNIIINKCDLSAKEDIENIVTWLRSNKYCKSIYSTINTFIPIDFFIEPHYDNKQKLLGNNKSDFEGHNSFYKSITIKTPKPFHRDSIIRELRRLPKDVFLRIKGIINLYDDPGNKYILNTVDDYIELSKAENLTQIDKSVETGWINFISFKDSSDYNLDFFSRLS